MSSKVDCLIGKNRLLARSFPHCPPRTAIDILATLGEEDPRIGIWWRTTSSVREARTHQFPRQTGMPMAVPTSHYSYPATVSEVLHVLGTVLHAISVSVAISTRVLTGRSIYDPIPSVVCEGPNRIHPRDKRVAFSLTLRNARLTFGSRCDCPDSIQADLFDGSVPGRSRCRLPYISAPRIPPSTFTASP